jgi:predicted DNA-binding protein (MmcQ/YjbR family)
MLTEAQMLARLREVCLTIPSTTETMTFGHPTFQVNGKTFCVFEEYKGELGICVKVEMELQGVFLEDPRFFRTPYIGKHGWVTLKIYAARLNWTEIRALVRGSYRLVAAGRPSPRDKNKTNRTKRVRRRSWR